MSVNICFTLKVAMQPMYLKTYLTYNGLKVLVRTVLKNICARSYSQICIQLTLPWATGTLPWCWIYRRTDSWAGIYNTNFDLF